MTLIESIIARAKSNKQRIVLPESLEERTLTAADQSLADEIADIILIGNPDEIFALADKLGLKNIGYSPHITLPPHNAVLLYFASGANAIPALSLLVTNVPE